MACPKLLPTRTPCLAPRDLWAELTLRLSLELATRSWLLKCMRGFNTFASMDPRAARGGKAKDWHRLMDVEGCGRCFRLSLSSFPAALFMHNDSLGQPTAPQFPSFTKVSSLRIPHLSQRTTPALDLCILSSAHIFVLFQA